MASKLRNSYFPELLALSFTRKTLSNVTVNLTHRCNQNCIYCEIGNNEVSGGKDKLSRTDLFWIIDQMVMHKIPKLSLCGGEPFLFDGIIDIIAYAADHKIRTSITTNGMKVKYLTPVELDVLKRSGTEINVSVDSFLPEIQGLTRGHPEALSNALLAIDVLLHKGIPLTLLVVITKFNYLGLHNFFIESYKKGIKQVLFQPVIYYSNFPERVALKDKSQLNVQIEMIDDLMHELNNILQFERKHQIKSNVYRILPWLKQYLITAASTKRTWFFKDLLPGFYCRELYAIIDISYEGGIQPCGLCQAKVFIINKKDRDLLELWSEATQEIRQHLEQGNFYDFCNGCCHHFSRNMLASIYKFPVKNRKALMMILPLLFSRIRSGIYKKIFA